jgi:hypothetical protein
MPRNLHRLQVSPLNAIWTANTLRERASWLNPTSGRPHSTDCPDLFPIFGEQNLRQELGTSAAARNWKERRRTWVIASRFRQANFSRTCWITFQHAETYSSASDVLANLG